MRNVHYLCIQNKDTKNGKARHGPNPWTLEASRDVHDPPMEKA